MESQHYKTRAVNVGHPENDKKKEQRHHLSSYPLSRLSPTFELVDLAREIAMADDMLTAQANGKLRLLAEQIKGLQEEARKILEEVGMNQKLHQAQCSFKKKVGHVYHLYRESEGRLIFSLLSPAEWGERIPYEFAGSFRLESDMSWTKIEELD